MTPWRSGIVVGLLVLGSVVMQTTLFGRINVSGIGPDVVTLVLVLLTFRLRAETSLLLAFTTGLVVDSLGSAVLGLRALTLTVVVFVALRTKERADYSPLAAAVWVLVLSLLSVVLLVVVGTLVSQSPFGGGEALRRILLVPLFTFVVALLAWPVLARLIEPVRRSL